MTITFSKYHGTGNDFILIDDREESHALDSDTIQKICHRHYGIGGDGLIFLRSSSLGDYSMEIFNSDGSPAEMCGNGLRCLIRFIHDLGDKKKAFQIETKKKIYPCSIHEKDIVIHMGSPHLVKKRGNAYFIEVGVPHYVQFVEDLSLFEKEAKKRFSVLKVNINYAILEPPNILHVRTFERGVEEETFSCGSGGAAVSMAAWDYFGISGPIEMIFGSRERLHYEIQTGEKGTLNITMSGQVSHVFDGIFKGEGVLETL